MPKNAAPVNSDSDGPEGLLESPSANRASSKRSRSAPKASYVEIDDSDDEFEEEYVPLSKRVKTEPVEEDLFQDEV
jgi:hypothetical protein